MTRTLALLVTLLVSAVAAMQQRAQSESVATEKIFEALTIREGSTVCEIGAGDGELSLAAAKLVGPAGRVYTSELGDDRVKTLQQKIAASGLAHDHHFEDPAAMNKSIAAAVKPGGRVAVVDFTPPGKEAERPSDRDKDGMHGISAESLARELKEAGFEQIASERGSQRWFMVVVSNSK